MYRENLADYLDEFSFFRRVVGSEYANNPHIRDRSQNLSLVAAAFAALL